jgi:hypothetical protein
MEQQLVWQVTDPVRATLLTVTGKHPCFWKNLLHQGHLAGVVHIYCFCRRKEYIEEKLRSNVS